MMQNGLIKALPRLLGRYSGKSFRTFSTTVKEDLSRIQMTSSGPIAITTECNIVDTQDIPKWPVFRVLDPSGNIIEGAEAPDTDPQTLVKMYEFMGRIRQFDDIMYNAQRQGRISFYMQHLGEEGSLIGSAASLKPQDLVLAQYREAGVLFWRGFTMQQAADQCFSNIADKGKGRQMPVHYGCKELNFQTISSPLATQLPQAVGAAYMMKRKNTLAAANNPDFNLVNDGEAVICYFGDGAASEGDFHAALNFSATLEVPIIFFCRNNGYAISTPVEDQFRGDGIISRAAGYGMKAVRVDGNDIMAVQRATKEAREMAIVENRPVLIEAMTYRGGHHSTSDDSTRYRSMSEILYWQENFDPMTRLRTYLEKNGWWSEDDEQRMKDRERMAAIQAMEYAEAKAKPPLEEMFTDIYFDKPPNLQRQEKELLEHIANNADHYKTQH
jgi:2-oxoisovalerate dehydrogenase E1 component alpha subunit